MNIDKKRSESFAGIEIRQTIHLEALAWKSRPLAMTVMDRPRPGNTGLYAGANDVWTNWMGREVHNVES